MKISFLTKRRDACYQIRVLTPSSNLVGLGHEIKEELLELQAYCQRCRGQGMSEFQYTDGDSFRCPSCSMDMGENVSQWRQSLMDQIDWADLVVFQRPTDLAHLKLMKIAKEKGKKIIFEGDDDYINVPKWNPGYKYYTDRRGLIEEMLRINDGVTVTTDQLQTVYDTYNKNIAVLPNCIDIEIMDCEPNLPSVPVFDRGGNPIPFEQYQEIRKNRQVIGWGGSPTHEMDLELVVKALRKIARKENAIIAMVGYVHRALIEVIPANQLFLFGLVPCSVYFSLYKTIKFDIGIAPVAPIKFNRGKSPNKLLEYHALGILGVASDFVTYKDYIHRGFLANPNNEEGWTNALRWAINAKDKTRDERLTANRKYVEENFDIKTKVKLWDDFYKKTLEG